MLCYRDDASRTLPAVIDPLLTDPLAQAERGRVALDNDQTRITYTLVLPDVGPLQVGDQILAEGELMTVVALSIDVSGANVSTSITAERFL